MIRSVPILTVLFQVEQALIAVQCSSRTTHHCPPMYHKWSGEIFCQYRKRTDRYWVSPLARILMIIMDATQSASGVKASIPSIFRPLPRWWWWWYLITMPSYVERVHNVVVHTYCHGWRNNMCQGTEWYHVLINYEDEKTKCRLCWCLIQFIDWRYSQSSWYFRPSFVNYCPSNLLSGLPLPPLPSFPSFPKSSRVQTVCGWEGVGDVELCWDHILQETKNKVIGGYLLRLTNLLYSMDGVKLTLYKNKTLFWSKAISDWILMSVAEIVR